MKTSIVARMLWSLASAAAFISPAVSHATPYASGIVTNSGTVSFILNEDADNVKIIFDGGGVGNTNDLGSRTKGTQSFPLGSHTSYAIHVTKSTAVGWTLISDDLNPLVRFYQPKAIAVFNNPSDLSRFGRIYVGNSTAGTVTDPPAASARTVGKGFYVLNADRSDALGYGATAQTAGITFDSTANSPFKIEIGEDNLLYISDYSNPAATIYRADADVTSSEVVLAGIGYNVNPTVHTDIEGSAIAKGSLAGGDLRVWAIDGSYGGTGNKNRLMRWDINAGPLPYNNVPTLLGTAGNGTVEVQSDLDIAPDGKFFLCQNRAFNTNTYEVGRVNIRVYDTDGVTLLWDSFDQSIKAGLTNKTTGDVFVNARAIKVSPDGTRMAMIRDDTQTWIVNLTNGIPDITTRVLLNTFGATTTGLSNGREVSWDVAGNLYVSNLAHEKLRVWSPGGSKTAITTSAGTFQTVVPATVVSVSASIATANEQGPVHGQFTLTRTGDSSAALTVSYTVTGTATPGSDYTALSGTVTFTPGAASVNIPVTVIDDNVAELTETVILTITGSANYGIGTGSATVSILDNETPEVSFVAAPGKKLLEGYASSKVTYQVTRRGLLAPALTVNLSYSGTATRGTDYNSPATVSIGANIASANITLTPIDDLIYEGDETIVATISTGSGYVPGATNSVTATLIDNETPAGTILFADNFAAGSSSLWTINFGGNSDDAHADFGFDYSQLSVPAAPGASSTVGLRLRVNETTGDRNAISLSPSGLNLPNEYRLKFNMWINYNGPMLDGGPGSTFHFNAGVGTTGDHINSGNSGASDGIWFSVDGDGGSTFAVGDCNAYAGADPLLDDSGVYAAGTTDNPRSTLNPFYSLWGNITAPPGQVTAYPNNQTGTSQPGNMGMAWHTFVITKTNDVVIWTIDGITIATVPAGLTGLANNIFIGYADQFPGTITSVPAMSFALVDNLRVETLTAPASMNITGIQVVGGNAQITFTGSAADSTSSFKLQSAGTVNGTYADEAATITSPSSGVFQATVPVNGATRFYRIKR